MPAGMMLLDAVLEKIAASSARAAAFAKERSEDRLDSLSRVDTEFACRDRNNRELVHRAELRRRPPRWSTNILPSWTTLHSAPQVKVTPKFIAPADPADASDRNRLEGAAGLPPAAAGRAAAGIKLASTAKPSPPTSPSSMQRFRTVSRVMT
jgi:hypothetical protein